MPPKAGASRRPRTRPTTLPAFSAITIWLSGSPKISKNCYLSAIRSCSLGRGIFVEVKETMRNSPLQPALTNTLRGICLSLCETDTNCDKFLSASQVFQLFFFLKGGGFNFFFFGSLYVEMCLCISRLTQAFWNEQIS